MGEVGASWRSMGGHAIALRHTIMSSPIAFAGYSFASRGICPALAQTHKWGKKDSVVSTPEIPHRPKRKFPPVRFHPDELRPEAATGKPAEQAPEIKLETGAEKPTNTQPEIFPPPKPKAENHEKNHKENHSKTHDETTEQKPP